MTAQATETLIYKGEAISLCEEPLAVYFKLMGKQPQFEAPHTALWRGYVGNWEIMDDRLYLIGLKGWAYGNRQVDLSFIFPDYPTRVFAHWLSGILRATCGEQLKCVHAGYASIHEQDVFFDFEDGVLKCVKVKHNAFADVEH